MPTVMYSKGWLPRWLRGTLSAVTSWTEWVAARYFFSIVTATPHIQQRFARANPTAVAIKNFPIVAELGQRIEWDGKSRAVCYVGGFASIRGIREMVEAIGSVEPPATLLLAGAFVNPAERDEVRRRPGWARVEELGFLDRDGIRGVLARSMAGLVTLHPVPNYVDALPVKMFEYMCAGIPVVASDFPVWREIVAGSGCGLLVDPLDSHQVAAAIERLLADPEAARQMGARGREAVLSKYSWEIEEQELLALYRALAPAWVPGRASP